MKNTRTNDQHLNDKELDICECSDNHCPACFGQCKEPATTTLYRIDMQDLTGTRFCEACADDAFESGLFTSKQEEEED